MHVLIVDDEPVQRMILTKQLVRLGYDVRTATDGADAWRQLENEPSPIVITDWMMPQIDGPMLIARIRAATFPGYTYTILLTSRDDRSDVIAGLDAGADDYITKPCNTHELRARVAIAARIVDLERRLRAARDTDALTGLYNRGAVAAIAEREIARAHRTMAPLTLALLDVDHFKQVNDRYGHQAGDQALQFVAAQIQAHLRPYDTVGRWGGEELLLILPGVPLRDALGIAERVRAAIAAAPLTLVDGRQMSLSASLGVVSVEGGECGALEALIRDADAALYRAKAAGRNCVKHYADDAYKGYVDAG